MPIRVTGKGNALRFDGIDDYVEVSDSPSLRFGSDSFTVELWVKSSVAQTHASAIKRNGGKYYLGLRWTTHGIFALNDGASEISVEGTTNIIDGKWHLLVAVCRRETQLSEIYVDGDFENEEDISSLGDISPTGALWIARGYYGSEYQNGTIDEVRIYNRALSPEEVAEHYNGIFNDESGLVLHLPFSEGRSGRTLDKSGYNNHGTIHGAEWVNKVTGGLRFDGVDDYVEVSNAPSLNFGAIDSFSIEAWIKTTVGNRRIVRKRVYPKCYSLFLSDEELRFEIQSTAGDWQHIIGTKSLIDGVFHHIVVVRNKVDGKLYLYVDGVSDAPPSNDLTGDLTNTGDVFIGSTEIITEVFDGIIDKIRVYKRILNADEILARFKGQEIDRTGLVLDLPFSECEGTIAKDRSGYGNDGSIIGAEWVVKRNTRLSAASRTLAVTR